MLQLLLNTKLTVQDALYFASDSVAKSFQRPARDRSAGASVVWQNSYHTNACKKSPFWFTVLLGKICAVDAIRLSYKIEFAQVPLFAGLHRHVSHMVSYSEYCMFKSAHNRTKILSYLESRWIWLPARKLRVAAFRFYRAASFAISFSVALLL